MRPVSPQPIRVLIDGGAYMMANYGDIAMLQIVLDRIRQCWNDPEITVITPEVEALRRIAPDVQALSPKGRAMWLDPSCQFGRYWRFLPDFLRPVTRQVARRLQEDYPRLGMMMSRWNFRQLADLYCQIESYLLAMRRADLFLISGGGFIADVFGEFAIQLMSSMAASASFGAVVAMVGQGLGPLTIPALRSMASRSLSRCSLIAVRESDSLRLAMELGVPRSRMMVTGDDATELGYRLKAPSLGSAIGFNLRIAPYAGMTDAHVGNVIRAVRRLNAATSAPILAIPISKGRGESDLESIMRLLPEATPDEPLETAEQVIRHTGRCRVAVVGSYHAAVFSLSQGIGVVMLVGSDYYQQKMAGLAEQYHNVGSRIVRVDRHENPEEEIVHHASQLWHGAEYNREPLLNDAESQIAASRAAFDHIRQLLDCRRSPAGFRSGVGRGDAADDLPA